MMDPVASTLSEALLIEALAPRPLVWVTTSSSDGEVNLAPFSAVTIICNSPPTLLLAIERTAEGRMKRTAENIFGQRDFVVNSPSREQLGPLMRSADPAVCSASRTQTADVRFAASSAVNAPFIIGCNSALECRMIRHECMGDFPQSDIFWAAIVGGQLRPVDEVNRARPFLGALGYEWFVSEEGLHFIEQPYL